MEKISISSDSKVGTSAADALIVSTFARLDAVALGVSFGILLGFTIFFATNLLVFKGGDVVGPNLALLSQYFIGFEVTFLGSLIGFVYGLMSGFIVGFLIASLRNFIMRAYLHLLRLRGTFSAVNDFIDNP